MGREAVCTCDWAGTVAEVKALLEPAELIVRGEIRKRVPFTEMKHVKAESDFLSFTVGCETVQLRLGSSIALKWASTMTSPPPSLSRKLGITNETAVRTIGSIRDENLKLALAEAGRVSARDADLIVACVDTPESLHAALKAAKTQLAGGVPVWMIYPKGAGHALNETAIRDFLRAHGLMDTKVASVSDSLTALRFSIPKSNEVRSQRVKA
jgi:hypothetical protein